MKLIFCRHGETVFNVEDRFQGVSDSPLTTNGIEHAKAINKFLRKNCAVKKFIISPLPRVHQTYEILAYRIQSELEIEQKLREICYGDWETKKREDVDPQLLLQREVDRYNFIHPGAYLGIAGENYAHKFEVIEEFLVGLRMRNDREDIVVVSHHGVMIAIIKYFQNLSDKEAGLLRVPNNKVFIVEKRGEEYQTELVEFN